VSETVTVQIAGTPVPVILYDPNTFEAARQAGIATAAANSIVVTHRSLKNRFNPAAIVPNMEIYNDGTYGPDSTSTISGPVYVGDLQGKYIHVSGLQPATGSQNRFYSFFSGAPYDATTFIAGGTSLLFTYTEGSIRVPIGANYFIFCTRMRNSNASDVSSVQVEVGSKRTAYEAYTPAVGAIGGELLAPPDPSRFSVGVLAAIGDSITRDSLVNPLNSPGVSLNPNPYDNWPRVAVPKLNASRYDTYARGGATFGTYGAQAGSLTLEGQITALIANFTANAVTPNVIVIALGTNDYHASATGVSGYGGIGDFATAMGKVVAFDVSGNYTPTGPTALNKAVSLEALRLGLLRLRWKFPSVNIFVCSPLQRTLYTPVQMIPFIDGIAAIAGACGCYTIDCFRKSGIVREFEVEGALGRDLNDGLHPILPGWEKQGKMIAAEVIAALDV
jgi:GDSL-like Lipase/Acylhydrolase family